MRGYYCNEKDWKLFRSKIASWQENYMDKLEQEYIKLLKSDANPSEKFWELSERIKIDKKKVGVRAEMRRSNMDNIISLINEGAIELADLGGFSEELREKMEFLFRDREA